MSRSRLEGTLTIRLNVTSARALRKRARAEGKSASEVVRSMIERELETEGNSSMSAFDRSRRFVGSIREGPVVGGRKARVALEAWKPDRRG